MSDQLSDRVRALENQEWAQILIVTADPNGVLAAPISTFAWDKTNTHLYINTDGSTSWLLVV